MKDELVTFDTAKLAKEKGFPHTDSDTHEAYHIDGDFGSIFKSDKPYTVLAPTQSLLASWLRLTFNYHVYCVPYDKDLWEVNICTSDVTWNVKNHLYYDILARDNYKTYEEAMEIGLVQALKLI